MTPQQLNDEVRHLLAGVMTGVPLPAEGSTRERLRAMVELGRTDLSVARIVEPHLDAIAILAEAHRRPRPGALYGVWASESARPLQVRRGTIRTTLVGQKSFCGGAALCDAALVTAVDVDGGQKRLVEIDLVHGRDAGTITADSESWRSPAFESTTTSIVSFHDHPVLAADQVGGPGYYLERPGFWHGALAPAAVWSGGAMGLLDDTASVQVRSPHQRANVGQMRALTWAMRAQLDIAADEADSHPEDVRGARRRALTVRHLVERQCTEFIDHFSRAYGPRPMVFDDDVIRRVQELQLYIRQVHSGEDLEELGNDSVGSESS